MITILCNGTGTSHIDIISCVFIHVWIKTQTKVDPVWSTKLLHENHRCYSSTYNSQWQSFFSVRQTSDKFKASDESCVDNHSFPLKTEVSSIHFLRCFSLYLYLYFISRQWMIWPPIADTRDAEPEPPEPAYFGRCWSRRNIVPGAGVGAGTI